MTMQQPARLHAVSRTIDRAAILAYAAITDDFNPIHVDEAFAAGTPMKGVIAHGMLSLNLIWLALRETCGPRAAEGATLDVRFARPVRVDDVVTASGARTAPGAYDVALTNQHGEAVVTGRLTLRTPGDN